MTQDSFRSGLLMLVLVGSPTTAIVSMASPSVPSQASGETPLPADWDTSAPPRGEPCTGRTKSAAAAKGVRHRPALRSKHTRP